MKTAEDTDTVDPVLDHKEIVGILTRVIHYCQGGTIEAGFPRGGDQLHVRQGCIGKVVEQQGGRGRIDANRLGENNTVAIQVRDDRCIVDLGHGGRERHRRSRPAAGTANTSRNILTAASHKGRAIG